MEWRQAVQKSYWGDYGDYFISGRYELNNDLTLRLERAGPYLPPISFPRGMLGTRVILTDECRQRLLQFPDERFSFRKADYKKVVRSEWHNWDRSKMLPEFPEDSEPEYFLIDGEHDPQMASSMEQPFELIIPIIPLTWESVESTEQNGWKSIRCLLPDGDYPAWFCSDLKHGVHFVHPSLQTFLANTVPEWIDFEPICYRRIRPKSLFSRIHDYLTGSTS